MGDPSVVPPGVVVAGTHSGCGKTTVALALMAAFTRRGLRVAPFKVGPDFIDPGHHKQVCKGPSHNLDTWMLTHKSCARLYRKKAARADVAIVEGVMGLYDGATGRDEDGSTAQLAKILGLPVLLVVDTRSMARSVAALVKGYLEFDPDLAFAGVILNRVGSPRHQQILEDALSSFDIPWLAFLPRDQALHMPSRHLGLFTASDHALGHEALERLADWLEENADLERLIQGQTPPCGETKSSKSKVQGSVAGDQSPNHPTTKLSSHPSLRIAVALDEAFCFYYQANLEMLQDLGAELIYFSPIRDKSLPSDISGIYLGGGYPELHADHLSSNQSLMDQIRKCSKKGMPIYAECGGFMYLCKGVRECVEDGRGALHCWVGLFPFEVQMEKGFRALGYREIHLTKDCPLGKAGTRIRGHEFHYSSLKKSGFGSENGILERVYQVIDAHGQVVGEEGYLTRNTLGSYVHLHFESRPEVAVHFVEACHRFASFSMEKGRVPHDGMRPL